MSKLEKNVNQLLESIDSNDYKELLDDGILSDIREELKRFREEKERLESEDKKLTIGIVGQVKAGKSSFLNSLFFNCEDILPKAATPMTAALTKIKYDEKIKAHIFFFTEDDWNKVEDGYNTALNLVKQERDKINELLRQKGKPETDKNDESIIRSSSSVPESDKGFFEMYSQFLKKNKKASLKACIKKNDDDKPKVLENINTIIDLQKQLEDYVGVNGEYTPIVKYVEVFLNIESIKDIDIVDTPGLNDPIISRGEKTRAFLGKCDVIFLLSPTSQFLDSNDMHLFNEQIPNKGIKEVVIVGSKFDNGIIGEAKKYNNDINVAFASITELLSNTAKANIANYIKNNSNKKFETLEKSLPPKYISSTCYNIYKKESNNEALSEDEELAKKNISRAFPNADLSPNGLKKISGIDIFKNDIMPEITRNKEKILAERLLDIDKTRYDAFENKFSELKNTVETKYNKFKSADIDKLDENLKKNEKIINKLQVKISGLYDNEKYNFIEKIHALENEIDNNLRNAGSVKTKTREENYTVNVETSGVRASVARFFNWNNCLGKSAYTTETKTKRETYTDIHSKREEIEHTLKNIKEEINEAFKQVINIDEFENTLQFNILSLVDTGAKDFDVDEFTNSLTVLKGILRRLNLTRIEFFGHEESYNFYRELNNIDDTNFDKIQSTVASIINKINDVLMLQIKTKTKEIENTLEEQSKTFVNELCRGMQKEVQGIKVQLQDKEKSTNMYKKCIEDLEKQTNEFKKNRTKSKTA